MDGREREEKSAVEQRREGEREALEVEGEGLSAVPWPSPVS